MLQEDKLHDIGNCKKQLRSVVGSNRFNSGAATGLGLFLLFALALGAGLVHNFLEPNTRTWLFADSWHYFSSCQLLSQWLVGLLHGLPGPAQHQVSSTLLLDGPVLPLLYALLFACVGKVPQITDWPTIVISQSIFHAVSAILVASITFRITGRRLVSWIAGAVWALYPGAIVATEHLMNEPMAVVLLLAYTFLMTQSAFNVGCYLASGLVLGLIILAKPALALAGLPALFIAAKYSKRPLATLSLVFMAAGLTVLPWLIYTMAVTGKPLITADRLPTHNAFIGWDIETDGWQTIPAAPRERLYGESDGPFAVMVGNWLANPRPSLLLAACKISRLYKNPWNEFRHSSLGLDPLQGRFLHWVLLFLGLCGITRYLLIGRRAHSPEARCCPDVCLAIAATSGLCALLLEPVPRYVFPTLPFFTIMGAYYFAQLRTPSGFKIPSFSELAIPAIASVLIFLCLIPQSEPESRCKHLGKYVLAPGCSVQRMMVLPAAKLPQHVTSALVLVDASPAVSLARIAVNGKELRGQILPLAYFSPDWYQLYNMMKELAYALNISVDDFWQWRAIEVPLADLNLPGDNTISITPVREELTVFADTAGADRFFHAPDLMVVNRSLSSDDWLDLRVESPVLTPKVKSCNSISENPGEKPNTGAAMRTLPNQLRLRLCLCCSGSSLQAKQTYSNLGADPEEFAQSTHVFRKISSGLFDPVMRDPNSSGIAINRSIVKYARTTACTLRTPLANLTGAYSICLKGHARTVERLGKIGIRISAGSKCGDEVVLARLPKFILAGRSGTDFEIRDFVPGALLMGGLDRVTIALYPAPWQEAGYGCDRKATNAVIDDLTLNIDPADLPDLSGSRLTVY